jgi:hypothetical protein
MEGAEENRGSAPPWQGESWQNAAHGSGLRQPMKPFILPRSIRSCEKMHRIQKGR